MARRSQYEELILRLGDLARERLAGRPSAPRALDRVLKAEVAVDESQRFLESLEDALNRLERQRQKMEAAYADEKRLLTERVSKSKKAVAAVQAQLHEAERKLDARRAELRSGHQILKKEEARQEGSERALQAVKKLRLAQLKLHREVEELERRIDGIVRGDGEPGEDEGVRAFRRLRALEREVEARRGEFDSRAAELEGQLADAEDALHANQEFLDKAVFLLGEDCFEQRLPDPMLAALYPSLEKLRRD